MASPREIAIAWADLPAERPIVLVPPTVAGLAAAVALDRAIGGSPTVVPTDPLDLAPYLAELATAGRPVPRLIVAGLPIDSRDLGTILDPLGRIAARGSIEWYDNHAWSPDSQTAIWAVCRKAEIGPDTPEPVHLFAHQLLDRSAFGLRLIDLAETGTDSTDAWVKQRYRLLAGVLAPERINLVPDIIARTSAEATDTDEVEWEIGAEQAMAEKTIERLAREELGVARASGGTRYLLADLGEAGASPYLFLACRRFFDFDLLIRVTDHDRAIVERASPTGPDLVPLAASIDPAARVRATHARIEIDGSPDRLNGVIRSLVDRL